MPQESLAILAGLFLVVGALYASVGHAGASGYLAVMALMGVQAAEMRPTALVVNILVATIASAQFWRAGHFSWRLFWPFAAGSVPAAFGGGMIHVPTGTLKVAIGVVLLLSAGRMAWTALRPPAAAKESTAPRTGTGVACGAGLGLVAGVTGTGGGIFLSPLLLMMNWADTKRTAATAALFVLVNSAAGLGGLATTGWRPGWSTAVLAGAACVGGAAGAAYGSRRATPRVLRLLLAVVLLVAGAKLVRP